MAELLQDSVYLSLAIQLLKNNYLIMMAAMQAQISVTSPSHKLV